MDEYGMFKDIPIIEVFLTFPFFYLLQDDYLYNIVHNRCMKNCPKKQRVFWLRQPEFFASTLRFLFDAISFLLKRKSTIEQ